MPFAGFCPSGTKPAPVPGIAAADLAEGSEKPSGPVLSLTLPAQSFTVIEAAMAPD